MNHAPGAGLLARIQVVAPKHPDISLSASLNLPNLISSCQFHALEIKSVAKALCDNNSLECAVNGASQKDSTSLRIIWLSKIT